MYCSGAVPAGPAFVGECRNGLTVRFVACTHYRQPARINMLAGGCCEAPSMDVSRVACSTAASHLVASTFALVGVWTFPRVQQMEDSTRFWNFGRRRHRQQAANKQAAQQGSRQCRPRQPAPRRWTTQTGARPVAALAAAAAAMTPAEAPQQARQRSHALSVCLLLRPGRWQLLQSEVQNGVPHQVRCGRF